MKNKKFLQIIFENLKTPLITATTTIATSLLSMICITQFQYGYLAAFGIPSIKIASSLSFSYLFDFLLFLLLNLITCISLRSFYLYYREKDFSAESKIKNLSFIFAFTFFSIYIPLTIFTLYQYKEILNLEIIFIYFSELSIYKYYLSLSLIFTCYLLICIKMYKTNLSETAIENFGLTKQIDKFFFSISHHDEFVVLLLLLIILALSVIISSFMYNSGKIFADIKTYYPSFTEIKNKKEITYIVIAEIQNHNYLCVDVDSVEKSDMLSTNYVFKDLTDIHLKNYEFNS